MPRGGGLQQVTTLAPAATRVASRVHLVTLGGAVLVTAGHIAGDSAVAARVKVKENQARCRRRRTPVLMSLHEVLSALAHLPQHRCKCKVLEGNLSVLMTLICDMQLAIQEHYSYYFLCEKWH